MHQWPSEKFVTTLNFFIVSIFSVSHSEHATVLAEKNVTEFLQMALTDVEYSYVSQSAYIASNAEPHGNLFRSGGYNNDQANHLAPDVGQNRRNGVPVLFPPDSSSQKRLLCQGKRYNSVYFYGRPLAALLFSRSENDCAMACFARKKCVSANYLPWQHRCELMENSVFDIPANRLAAYVRPHHASTYIVLGRCANGRPDDHDTATTKVPLTTHGTPATYQVGACGKAYAKLNDSHGHHRIVGGAEAEPHSHPWIVHIQTVKPYGRRGYHCGGTLVRVDGSNSESTDIVVTAAHCFDKIRPTSLEVVAGAHDVRHRVTGQQRIRIKQNVTHNGYSRAFTVNDIAIAVLEQPVMFSETVQPACLPNANEYVPAGTVAVVAGWGDLWENGDSPGELHEVAMPVTSHEQCQRMNNFKRIDAATMLCASAPGKDSCQGDSGGPLLVKDQTSHAYILQGVVSHGFGCARPDKPGIYMRVSAYVQWLKEQSRRWSALSRGG